MHTGFLLRASQQLSSPRARERPVKWHFLCLCSFHMRQNRSAIFPVLPPPAENTHKETQGCPSPASPPVARGGFHKGKKHQGGNSSIYFPLSVGQSWCRGQGAPSSCCLLAASAHWLSSYLPTSNNPCVLRQMLTVSSGCQSDQGWWRTRGRESRSYQCSLCPLRVLIGNSLMLKRENQVDQDYKQLVPNVGQGSPNLQPDASSAKERK